MTHGRPKIDIVLLANSVVLYPDETPVKLGLLWKNKKTILIFLRHFACIACRAHAVQVWQDREKYEKAGAQIIFIGNGQPQYINAFKEDLKIQEATIVTDPSLQSYRAVGFKYGFLSVVNPGSLTNVVSMAMNGHRQSIYTRDAGTHWQLGGIVALNPDGRMTYHYISQSVGDFPPAQDTAEYLNSTAKAV